MNSMYVRFTYMLLTLWLVAIGYVVHWFIGLGSNESIADNFVAGQYSWSTQTRPRGGPAPRIDGLVRGSAGTALLLPPVAPTRETDIVGPSNLKSQADIHSCFWPGPRARAGIYTTDPDDYAFEMQQTDLGQTNAMAWFKLPPNAQLVLKGQFPRARMLSFVLYDERGKVLDSTFDGAIDADPGQNNPFVSGIRREVKDRRYTLKVENGVAPGQRPANTLFSQTLAQETLVLKIFIHLPDKGQDWTGGVGLPKVELRTADEQVLAEAETCDLILTRQHGEQVRVADWRKAWMVFNELPWAKFSRSPASGFKSSDMSRFYNSEHIAVQSYLPLYDLFVEYRPEWVKPVPRQQAWSHPYTHFGFIPLHMVYGQVYAVQGRLPTTPRTWDQNSGPMSTGNDMRYWSMCSTTFPMSDLTSDCLNDENLRTSLDAGGKYLIVASRLVDRPRNAEERCGVNWLQLGHNDGIPGGSSGYAGLVTRHTLPDAAVSTRTWSYVSSPGEEKKALGDVRPSVVNLYDKERFELLGCPINAVVLDRLRLGKTVHGGYYKK